MLNTDSVPAKRPAYMVVTTVLLAIAIVVMVSAAMRGSLTSPYPSERVFGYGAVVGALLVALWMILERAYLLWAALAATAIGILGNILLH